MWVLALHKPLIKRGESVTSGVIPTLRHQSLVRSIKRGVLHASYARNIPGSNRDAYALDHAILLDCWRAPLEVIQHTSQPKMGIR